VYGIEAGVGGVEGGGAAGAGGAGGAAGAGWAAVLPDGTTGLAIVTNPLRAPTCEEAVAEALQAAKAIGAPLSPVAIAKEGHSGTYFTASPLTQAVPSLRRTAYALDISSLSVHRSRGFNKAHPVSRPEQPASAWE
jgi:hypothetical protein